MDYGRYRNRTTPNAPASTKLVVNGVTTNTSYALPARESQQVYDFEVEDFRRRSAAGEIFNNPFLSVKTERLISDIWVGSSIGRSSVGGPITYSESYVHDRRLMQDQLNAWTLPVVDLDTEDAVRNAQLAALANVNATEVDVAAFAGEWSKTKNLHRDLGNAFLGLFTKAAKATTTKSSFKRVPVFDRRGNPILNRKGEPVYRYDHTVGGTRMSGETPTKRISDLYLTIRFGVMPLLDDLQKAVKLLQKKWEPRYTARGNASVQGTQTATKVASFGNYGDYTLRSTIVKTYDARYGILYESDPFSRALAQLGFSRPLSSVWQLMPWSFVADWFLQVGKYLDAIQPVGFTKTLCAWGSARTTTIVAIEVAGFSPRAGVPATSTYTSTWNGAYLWTTVVKQRDPWVTSIPRLPSLGTGFNAMRSGDFAALVLQRIRTKF